MNVDRKPFTKCIPSPLRMFLLGVAALWLVAYVIVRLCIHWS